jgi:hypothetical protein
VPLSVGEGVEGEGAVSFMNSFKEKVKKTIAMVDSR